MCRMIHGLFRSGPASVNPLRRSGTWPGLVLRPESQARKSESGGKRKVPLAPPIALLSGKGTSFTPGLYTNRSSEHRFLEVDFSFGAVGLEKRHDLLSTSFLDLRPHFPAGSAQSGKGGRLLFDTYGRSARERQKPFAGQLTSERASLELNFLRDSTVRWLPRAGMAVCRIETTVLLLFAESARGIPVGVGEGVLAMPSCLTGMSS